MTTVELAEAVRPYTRIEDVASATASDAAELARILSAGVQEFFALAPSAYRRTTVSSQQPGPETMEIFVSEGDNVVGGSPFTPAMRGCSIFIEGQLRPNEIVGEAELLNSYLGTTGHRQAIVYFDSLPILDFAVERIVTHPEAVDSRGNATPLVPLEAGSRTARVPGPDTVVSPFASTTYRRDRRAERPGYYWLEHVGGSRQVPLMDAVFQLRLWPIPTLPFLVQFDAEVFPIPYRLPDLRVPREIPVPDGLAHRTIIPLCRGLAVESHIASRALAEEAARAAPRKAETARDAIRSLTPAWTPPNQTIGTPEGW